MRPVSLTVTIARRNPGRSISAFEVLLVAVWAEHEDNLNLSETLAGAGGFASISDLGALTQWEPRQSGTSIA